MICPYCQHVLDVQNLSCPRCFAEYPRRGMPFGFGARMTIAASLMMLLTSLILVDCVLAYLPGGAHSAIPAGSRLFDGTQMPDFRSPDADRLMRDWQAHKQGDAQTLPGSSGRH